jgi:hypothetical protein
VGETLVTAGSLRRNFRNFRKRYANQDGVGETLVTASSLRRSSRSFRKRYANQDGG